MGKQVAAESIEKDGILWEQETEDIDGTVIRCKKEGFLHDMTVRSEGTVHVP